MLYSVRLFFCSAAWSHGREKIQFVIMPFGEIPQIALGFWGAEGTQKIIQTLSADIFDRGGVVGYGVVRTLTRTSRVPSFRCNHN